MELYALLHERVNERHAHDCNHFNHCSDCDESRVRSGRSAVHLRQGRLRLGLSDQPEHQQDQGVSQDRTRVACESESEMLLFVNFKIS